MFSTQKSNKKIIFGVSLGHLSIFLIDEEIFEKRIHNTFQIRGDNTQRQHKENFFDYRMKLIVLPYLESYFEETKYNLVKFYQFSCIQEYY